MDNSNQTLKEELGELLAEARASIEDIKVWYNSINDETASNLRNDFGEFPSSSSIDLSKWPHFKTVLRAFNKLQSQKFDNKICSPTPPKESCEVLAVKKKRSRFGDKNESSEVNGNLNVDEESQRKKSRFASADDNGRSLNGEGMGAGSGKLVSKGPSELRNLHQQKTFLLRLKIDDINRKLDTVEEAAKIKEKDPDRSPSPPPIYDADGKRVNVLEYRIRQTLQSERQQYMEELIKLNPSLKPKNMHFSLYSKKLYVPVNDYPGYNFLGLIIGPRGMTQKRLEKETNTKITIRGKGSVIPGRGKVEEDPHDDLHILVQGEDEDDVDKAADIVQKLLTPNHEFLEEHRQQQMQELALINGTLKQDDVCLNCGEKGHKNYECPNAATFNSTATIIVQCKICGEKSHVTADCPMKNLTDDERREMANSDLRVDTDYNEFMEMLGEKKVSKKIDSDSNSGKSRNSPTPPTYGQAYNDSPPAMPQPPKDAPVKKVKLSDYMPTALPGYPYSTHAMQYPAHHTAAYSQSYYTQFPAPVAATYQYSYGQPVSQTYVASNVPQPQNYQYPYAQGQTSYQMYPSVTSAPQVGVPQAPIATATYSYSYQPPPNPQK